MHVVGKGNEMSIHEMCFRVASAARALPVVWLILKAWGCDAIELEIKSPANQAQEIHLRVDATDDGAKALARLADAGLMPPAPIALEPLNGMAAISARGANSPHSFLDVAIELGELARDLGIEIEYLHVDLVAGSDDQLTFRARGILRYFDRDNAVIAAIAETEPDIRIEPL